MGQILSLMVVGHAGNQAERQVFFPVFNCHTFSCCSATVSSAVMKFAFRVDSSLQMGTGHVMRCITLAEFLRDEGGECCFVSREHNGNIIESIESCGFDVFRLSAALENLAQRQAAGKGELHQADWLGVDWMTDAVDTCKALTDSDVDWLIADHYAIDYKWEEIVRQATRNLMIIDDLADRPHDCDVLLDQTLGRTRVDYESLVRKHCKVLTGPDYALLRRRFSELRDSTLRKRKGRDFSCLLISMGGVDQGNATGSVLTSLQNCNLPVQCKITVVMGRHAPWLSDVEKLASEMPHRVEVLVNVTDMATLMADADVAIGAAGTSTWERCCLGLPTIVVVIAENQKLVARKLLKAHAVEVIDHPGDIESKFPAIFNAFVDPPRLEKTSLAASEITDGQGAYRVAKILNTMSKIGDGFRK
jgi:UDP-2,4-diacetamido-2,4,6-trideoxy-beta-L-altropyranose hydrolase